MTINLPEPIAAYFAADKLDSEAVARCFTRDAVVKDEAVHRYCVHQAMEDGNLGQIHLCM